jgi:LacI family transcriptional regulator
MAKRPRVALLVESSRAYGRGLLHGIAEYIRLHGPWSIYMEERGLGDDPPAWLKDWEGDGVIARIENRRIAHAIDALGLPAVDLRGVLPDLEIPLIVTDDEAVSQLAFGHLVDRGFRNFAFCGFVNADYSDNRSRAFARMVEDEGHACHVYQSSRKLKASGTMALEREGLVAEAEVAHWLEALPRPWA